MSLAPRESGDIPEGGSIPAYGPAHKTYPARKLDDQEKRDLYRELAKLLGEIDGDRCAQVKRQLAAKYECSTVQLDALEGRLTRAVKEITASVRDIPMSTIDAGRTVITVRDMIAPMATASARKAAFSTIAQELETKCGLIFELKEIRTIYRALVDATRQSEEGASWFEGLKIPLLRPHDEEHVIRNGDVRNVNFGPIKQRWRDTYSDYLTREFETHRENDGSHMSAACLPGVIEPEKELEIYKCHGIRRIYAVENGGNDNSQEAIRRFQAHLEPLRKGGWPVVPVVSDLCVFLDKVQDRSRLDVVGIDVQGWLTESNIKLLRKLLLKPRAYVMVNMQASREHNAIQGAYMAASQAIASPIDPQGHVSIGALRERSFDYIILSNIGLSREENRRGHAPLIKEIESHLKGIRRIEKGAEVSPVAVANDFLQFARVYAETIAHTLQNVPAGNLKLTREQLLELADLALDVCFGMARVANLEKWKYRSESSQNGLVFWSIFATVETPLRQYARWDGSAGFMGELVRVSLARPARSRELLVTTKRYDVIPPEHYAHNELPADARLCLSIDGQLQRQCSIPLETLYGDILRYSEWNQNFFARNPATFANVPRNKIQK